VPISIEGVITRLMQERSGARPSASLKEWSTVLEDLVAGERAENERLCAALNGVVEAARFIQGLPGPLSAAIDAARDALQPDI
jgi:hypothetical protein